MTVAVVTYCTQTDVERLLSHAGVTAFSDHDDDDQIETAVVTDCIQQASEELTLELHERYEETDLDDSPLVTRWCTLIAAYYLCMRRGNPIPESIANEYQRLLDPDKGLIVRVGHGKGQIPNIPLRCDMRPTWSNLKVDRRYPTSKTRVTKTNSSDAPTALTQDTRQEYPVYDY